MNPLRAVRNAYRWAVGLGSYDAVRAKGKRQAPTGILRSEDAELTPMERRKMLSGARTLHRNFSIAAWMVRTHLNYVSTFTFQARTPSRELNAKFENLVKWWSKPGNFDCTGRYSRQQFIRMAEARRTLDGDMGIVKLRNGLVQAIEGDRVRTPTGGMPAGYTAAQFVHGVKSNKFGRPLKYCVCSRGPATDAGGRPSQFIFERMVSARHMLHFGYFDRFDQVRGISPLATAVNTLRDTYESFDYALAKMKLSQLLGLVFYSQRSDDFDMFREQPAQAEGEEGEEPTDYEVELDNGPFKLRLDDNDRLEFLESKNPSSEFQAFSKSMIEAALKALDIPYSFYAENYTTYSGARQALLQYEQSADIKRSDVRGLLDELTAWRIGLWIEDGVIPAEVLPYLNWEWVPAGMPWIDPQKEVAAQIAAIGAGLTSRTRVCRSNGESLDAIIDELASEQRMFDDAGLPTNLAVTNSELIGTKDDVAATAV